MNGTELFELPLERDSFQPEPRQRYLKCQEFYKPREMPFPDHLRTPFGDCLIFALLVFELWDKSKRYSGSIQTEDLNAPGDCRNYQPDKPLKKHVFQTV